MTLFYLRKKVWRNGATHSHGQANAIDHYRLGLDCNCALPAENPASNIDSCEPNYNPETNAIKMIRNSGTKPTMSNAEYLKSKARTYEQKNTHFVKSTADTANNEYACATDKPCCTIWKPTNSYFNTDGGVSASSRLHKVKYQTIQGVASSFSNFDHSTVVAHAYSGRTEAPRTIMDKKGYPIQCGLFRRDGKKNYC